LYALNGGGTGGLCTEKKIRLHPSFISQVGESFFFVLEISRSHGSEYEDNSLLGYSAV
jgi:hypothetical protein